MTRAAQHVLVLPHVTSNMQSAKQTHNTPHCNYICSTTFIVIQIHRRQSAYTIPRRANPHNSLISVRKHMDVWYTTEVKIIKNPKYVGSSSSSTRKGQPHISSSPAAAIARTFPTPCTYRLPQIFYTTCTPHNCTALASIPCALLSAASILQCNDSNASYITYISYSTPAVVQIHAVPQHVIWYKKKTQAILYCTMLPAPTWRPAAERWLQPGRRAARGST